MLLAVALISDPDVYSHDFDLYHLICVLFFGVCFRIGTAAKSVLINIKLNLLRFIYHLPFSILVAPIYIIEPSPD